MNYKELIFTIVSAENHHGDLMIDALAQIGFESFENTDFGFKAYIQSPDFNEAVLSDTLEGFHGQLTFSYEINLIPQKNWNEVWESNFEPLLINDQCCVRATFHRPQPQYDYEIVIDPKMAFGTGHHQTTAMMMELMMEENFTGKNVLDMGCGTGILAILASKLGAKKSVAIDYDRVCYESTLENSKLNNTQNIQAICGSEEAIPNQKFDVILANINRNILLDQLESYAKALSATGLVFLSGFYEIPDLKIIIEKAGTYGLKYLDHKKDKDWVAVSLGFSD